MPAPERSAERENRLCGECPHLALETDPPDPGFPYMCEETGEEMLGPEDPCSIGFGRTDDA